MESVIFLKSDLYALLILNLTWNDNSRCWPLRLTLDVPVKKGIVES